MIWLDLFAHLFVVSVLGFLALCAFSITVGWIGSFFCAPTDSDDEWGEGDAWDRGHDEWVDRQNEVA